MPQREVVLWPTRENYDRFAELCDDTVAETFDDFERNALATMGNLAAQGIILERVSFDPDRMAQWCRANFGAFIVPLQFSFGPNSPKPLRHVLNARRNVPDTLVRGFPAHAGDHFLGNVSVSDASGSHCVAHHCLKASSFEKSDTPCVCPQNSESGLDGLEIGLGGFDSVTEFIALCE